MPYKRFYSIFLMILLIFSLIPLSTGNAQSFNLTAETGCGYILLKWDNVPDAVRYYVYRGPGEGMEYSMPLTDFSNINTFYKDSTDLEVNKKYCYIVKAVGKDNKEFLQSNETCAIMTCMITECKMELKYQVDNKYYFKNTIQKGPMDTAPELRYSRVYLMARYLAEEIGASVYWESTSQIVIIKTLDGKTIEMQIGNHLAKVNGILTPIDPNNASVVPYISNDRTYTPLRFISYNLGATGPSDIVWQSDSNTAVLTFKDPNCNWICGCIRKLPPKSVTSSIIQYGFYENCDIENPFFSKIPLDLKDQIFGMTFQEYFQKYPNQNYWCLEIRIDEAGNIIEWQAKPDQYPNCCKTNIPTECNWVYGNIQKWIEAPNGNLSIFFSKDCIDTTDLVSYVVQSTLKDTNLNITFLDYFQKYSLQKYWCLGLCVGPNNNIVSWKATPEKYPKCCDQEIVKKICGCIVQISTQTDINGYYQVYIKTDCQSTISNPYDLVLYFSSNLLDQNMKLSALAYYNSIAGNPPKPICIEAEYLSSHIVTKWWAFPDRNPCCEITDKGRITGILPANSIIGTKVVIYDKLGNIVWSGLPDANGNFDTACTLTCLANYIIKPINEKCKFIPESSEVNVKCCPEVAKVIFSSDCSQANQNGRIVANFPVSSIEGTNVVITDMTGNTVWNGTPSVSGTVDTDCNLKCSITYRITPTNSKCTFTPLFQDVKVLCCPDITKVNFTSNCNQNSSNGRIKGYVPTDSISGTMIHIYDDSGNLVWSGYPNTSGYFDTDNTLTCSTYYKVVPANSSCTFIPEYSRIYVKCSNITEVDFDSDCNQSSYNGRIKGYVPTSSISGTKIYIYDDSGNLVWSGNPNTSGYFDTGNSLTCGEYYKVQPTNSRCRFTPEYSRLYVQCSNISEVDFDSDCSQNYLKGRLTGYIPLNNITSTKIYIYDSSGYLVWSGNPNINGYFDTDCDLICSAYYTIIPKSDKCTFIPESIKKYVSCCPDVARVDFDSDCSQTSKMGRIYGKVTGNNNPVKIKIVGVGNTTYSGIFTTNATTGAYETSQENLGNCILPCPGTYRVTPVPIAGIEFTPAYVDIILIGSCSDQISYEANFVSKLLIQKGSIKGSLGTESAGATITITKVSRDRERPLIIKADVNGNYDSGCVLECGATYNVIPTKDGCRFTPPNSQVKITNCCPDGYATANFTSSCEPAIQKGSIKGSLGTESAGATITITKVSRDRERPLIIKADVNGNYDSGCVLECGATYNVIPTKDGCRFTPPNSQVKITNCCPDGYATANFTSSCEPAIQKGSIKGSLGTESAGATITITKVSRDRERPLIIKADVNGNYDSGCVLECGATYNVIPTKDGCRFTPPNSQVKITNCCPDGYATANFTSSCEPAIQKGSIKGSLGTESAGATITITKVSRDRERPVIIKADVNGNYDSGCVLECGATYNVIPTKDGCRFTPPNSQVKITNCCPDGYATANFTSSCEPAIQKGSIKITVLGDYTDTTITISTLSDKLYLITSGKVDENGIFDSGCKLICGNSYIVTAEPKQGCQIYYNTARLKINNCCTNGYQQFSFTVTCSEPTSKDTSQSIPKSREIQFNDKVLYLYDDTRDKYILKTDTNLDMN